MSEANRFLCFADFEFTCGVPVKRFASELLSAGLVICNADYEIEATFYQTMRPVRYHKLTKRCRELTHLTQAEITASADSNTVMRQAVQLLRQYQITELYVWGNFDEPGIRSDQMMHRRMQKNDDALREIAGRITDIQRSMTLKMDLPEAVRIQELAEAFGYEPQTGSFHNALNDAMALYEIHKAVFTTDFLRNPGFTALRESRIEKREEQRRLAFERRREAALAVTMSPELRSYYDEITRREDDTALQCFVHIRSKMLKALREYPDETDFLLLCYTEPKQVHAILRRNFFPKKRGSAKRVVPFTPENMDACLLTECRLRDEQYAGL